MRADKTVAVRPVAVGTTAGDNASIETGLSAGEVVVVDGADKLEAGTHVRPLQQARAPSGQPHGTCFLRIRPRRPSYGAGPGQCESSERQLRWSAAGSHQRQRSARYGRCLSTSHCGLPKWRSSAAFRCGGCDRWRRKRHTGCLDRHPSGRDRQYSAPARSANIIECGGPHPDNSLPQLHRVAAGVGTSVCSRPTGPSTIRASVRGRAVRADADRRHWW